MLAVLAVTVVENHLRGGVTAIPLLELRVIQPAGFCPWPIFSSRAGQKAQSRLVPGLCLYC